MTKTRCNASVIVACPDCSGGLGVAGRDDAKISLSLTRFWTGTGEHQVWQPGAIRSWLARANQLEIVSIVVSYGVMSGTAASRCQPAL